MIFVNFCGVLAISLSIYTISAMQGSTSNEYVKTDCKQIEIAQDLLECAKNGDLNLSHGRPTEETAT